MENQDQDEAHQRRWAWWQSIKKDKAKLARVAEACGTSPGYLRQVANSHGTPSVDMAKRLGQHTGLSRKYWLPEAWG